MVDDGAPYSAIGQLELSEISKKLILAASHLDRLPSSLRIFSYWQYGTGSHASPRRIMLGCVQLSIRTNSGNLITIRHLVIEGSSQWVIGQNVTRRSNIIHIGKTVIEIPYLKPAEEISMVDLDDHSYILSSRFF